MYIKKKWILVFSFIFVGFLVYFGKNMITSEGKESKGPEKKTDYKDSKNEEESDKLPNKNKPLIEEEEIAGVTKRLDITDMFKINEKDCKNELKTNELQNSVIYSAETEETLTKTDDFLKEKSTRLKYLMNLKNNSVNTLTSEGAADFKKSNEHEKILNKESQTIKPIKEETKSLKEESDHEDKLYLYKDEAMLFSVFHLFKDYEKELNSSLMKKDENILNILSFLKGNRKNIKKTYQEFVTLVEIFDEIYQKHDKRNEVACFAQFIINYLVNKDSLALNGIKEHGSDTNKKISSFAKRFCIPIKYNETFYLERYLEINRGDGITIDSDFEFITIDFKKYFDEQDCTFLPNELIFLFIYEHVTEIVYDNISKKHAFFFPDLNIIYNKETVVYKPYEGLGSKICESNENIYYFNREKQIYYKCYALDNNIKDLDEVLVLLYPLVIKYKKYDR